MPTMFLHNASRLGNAVTHNWSIQYEDKHGPIGVVCLFDVPPDEDEANERLAAKKIFLAVSAHDDLLAACKAQHEAIDTLLAMLVVRDHTFFPTQSPVWPKLLQGNAAIVKAEGSS